MVMKSNSKNNFMSKNSGITLVALVITIIVLVIIVGVTLKVTTDHKLISQTEEIGGGYQQQQAKEALLMNLEKLKLNSVENKIRDKETRIKTLKNIDGKNDGSIEVIKDSNGEVDIVTYKDGTYPAARVLVDGFEFYVDGELNILPGGGTRVAYYTIKYYKENIDKTGYDIESERKIGEVGNSVTAEIKSYDGFTHEDKGKESGTVGKDGDLVLEVYYSRNNYTATFTGGTPETITKAYEAELGTLPTIAKAGYDFLGWFDTNGNQATENTTMPLGGVTYEAKWDALEAGYTVEYYKQNVAKTGYDLVTEDTQNLTGTTESSVIAEKKTYDGFTFDESNKNNILTGKIAGDGSLVLKVYYSRNNYTATFTGGTPETITKAYEDKLGTLPTIAKAGYDFKGWFDANGNQATEDTTMPLNGVTYNAKWEARTDTPYKIEYYKENVTKNGYDIVTEDTQNLTGTTDSSVSVGTTDIKAYDGFYYEESNSNNILTGTIAGDGSLVLKVYYYRHIYTATFPGGTIESKDVPYEAQLGELPTIEKAGYTFLGWFDANGNQATESTTMPLGGVAYEARWKANVNTAYKVEYYKQNIAKTGYDLAETVAKEGTTDTLATAEKKTYDGFTFDESNESNILTGNIAGDESLVLKVYYNRNDYTAIFTDGTPGSITKAYEDKFGTLPTIEKAGYDFKGWFDASKNQATENTTMPLNGVTYNAEWDPRTDTSYKVEYYRENIGRTGYDLAETVGKTGTTESSVTAEIKTYDGFTFEESNESNILTGTIAGDGSLVLKVYYSRNSCTVTFIGGTPETITRPYESELGILPTIEKAGYIFVGWFDENGVQVTSKTKMPLNGATCKASWEAGEANYTVEYYKQNIAKTGYDLAETETTTGKTESLATAVKKTYDGFTFDESNANNVLTGTIAGEGNLVLKVYYSRNSYTATFTGGTPETITKAYEDKLGTLPTIEKAGYDFKGWFDGSKNQATEDTTMPLNGITYEASWEARTDTPYKIEYYKQNVSQTGYDLAETVAKEGTTDTLATAEIKSYDGFDHVVINDSKESENIVGDGTLVLKVYYNRKTFQVNLSASPSTGGDVTGAGSYVYGATVTIVATPKDGYTFEGWNITSGNVTLTDSTFTMPAENVTISATFKGKDYTINYNGNGATKGITASTTHTWGATTQLAENGYERQYTAVLDPNGGDEIKNEKANYTFNGWKVRDNEIGSVDKTTNTYIPSAYQETVELDADWTGGEITLPAATRQGYVFKEWYTDDGKKYSQGAVLTLTKETTFHANWEASNKTGYKVEHYLPNGTGYTTEVDNLQGTTGEEVTAVAREFKKDEFEYLYDSTNSNNVTTGTIQADGSLILKLYYNKKTYQVTFVPNYGEEIPPIVREYGEKLGYIPTIERAGYDEIIWCSDQALKNPVDITTNDIVTNDVTYYGKWNPSTVNYQVEYYQQNVDDDEYTLKETVTKTATTDTTVTAETANDRYVGFSFDTTNANNILTGTVAGDGSLVLKAYYNRLTPQVTINRDLEVGGEVTGEGTYKYGSTVTLTAAANSGYSFNGWEAVSGLTLTEEQKTQSSITFIMPATEVKLKAIFTAKEYTINYDSNGGSGTTAPTKHTWGTAANLATSGFKKEYTLSYNVEGTVTTETVADTQNGWKVSTDATEAVSNPYTPSAYPTSGNIKLYANWKGYGTVTLPTIAKAGYDFLGWYKDSGFTEKAGDAGANYDVDKTQTLYAKYVAKTDTTYTVEYYRQNVAKTGYDLAETVGKTGTTGAEAEIDIKTYAGFTYNGTTTFYDNVNKETITDSKILGNGGLVVKVYYDRNSIYTLTKSVSPSNGGTVTITPEKTAYTYEEEVTIVATTKTGYNQTNPILKATGVTLPTPTYTTNSEGQKVATVTLKMPANDVSISGTFTPNSHTVTATANPTAGGTITGAGSKTYGSTVTITATTNTGYNETNPELTATGVTLPTPTYTTNSSGQKVATVTFTMPNNDVNITANFTGNPHNVTGVKTPSEGGELTGTGSKNYGSTVTIVATTKTGYNQTNPKLTATGVTLPTPTYTTNSSGQKVATVTFTMPNNDVTITANFTANSHTVTATANPTTGGSVTGAGTYKYGSTVNLTATANTGYTFSKWNVTSGGVTLSSTTNTTTSFTMPDNDVAVEAVFTLNSHAVTVTANPPEGGTVTGAGSKDYGSPVNLTATANTGYSFSKWNVISGGVTLSSTTNPTTSFTMPDNEVKVEAVFTPITYTIQYDPNGGSGTTADSTHTYDASKNLTKNGFTRTGYQFGGWATSKDGTAKYEDEHLLTENLANTQGATVTLYATWNEDDFTVTTASTPIGTFTGAGTYKYGSTVTVTFTQTDYGYTVTLTGLDGVEIIEKTATTVKFKMPARNVAVGISASVNSYNVIGEINPGTGGTLTGTGSKNYGSIVTIVATTNTGYNGTNPELTATGVTLPTPTYTKNSEGQIVATVSFTMPSNNVTIKAKFTPNSHTVTATANPPEGGTVTGAGSKDYGSPVNLTATANTGYTFSKWNVTSGGVTLSSTTNPTTSFTMPDNDVTVKAEIPANTYTVTYNKNATDATGTTADSNHTYDVSKNLTKNGFTRTGYQFGGWSTTSTGAVVYNDQASVKNLTATKGGTVTLYAVWTPNTYTVTYNKNATDATGTTANSSHTYDVSKNLTKNGYSRTGYEFKGWSTTSTGSVVYNDQASVKNLTATKGGTVTLYAVWQKNSYTLTYNASYHGGNGITDGDGYYYKGVGSLSVQVPYGESIDLTRTANPANYIGIGWNFIGWGEQNSTTPYETLKMPASNLTIYAIFQKDVTVTLIDASNQDPPRTITAGTLYNGSTPSSMEVTLPSLTTYTNWTAKGWTDSTTSYTASVNAQAKATLYYSDIYYNDATYYGVYEGTTTVSYNANGGDSTPTDTTSTARFNSSGEYQWPKVTLRDGISRYGYTFVGWNTKLNGSGTNYLAGDNYTMSSLKETLYAQWDDDIAPSVSIGVNGTNVANGKTIEVSGIANLELDGWDANNKVNGYTYKVTKSGTTITSGTVAYVESLPVNIQLDESGTYQVTATMTDGYGNTTTVSITVVVKIEYTITYNVNGGTGGPSTQTGYGEVTITTSQPTRSGYYFVGWSKSKSPTSSNEYIYAGSTYSLTADVTLYAQWAVAQITNTGMYYETVQSAVTAATSKQTVELIMDVTTSQVSVSSGKELTLNLNSKTLTSTSSGSAIYNQGNLNVENGTIKNANSSGVGINTTSTGKLTIGGTTINANKYALQVAGTNSSTIKTTRLIINSGSYYGNNYAVYATSYTTVDINGGKIGSYLSGSGIYASNCNVNINNADVEGDGMAIRWIAPANGELNIASGDILTENYSVTSTSAIYASGSNGIITLGTPKTSYPYYPNNTLLYITSYAEYGIYTEGNISQIRFCEGTVEAGSEKAFNSDAKDKIVTQANMFTERRKSGAREYITAAYMQQGYYIGNSVRPEANNSTYTYGKYF